MAAMHAVEDALHEPLVEGHAEAPRGSWRGVVRVAVTMAFMSGGLLAVLVIWPKAGEAQPQLLSFPEPTSLEHANQLLIELPRLAADPEDFALIHISPKAKTMFKHFLREIGSSAPHTSSNGSVSYEVRHAFGSKAEFEHRLAVFGKVIRLIAKYNHGANQSDETDDPAVLGIGPFADWSEDEFGSILGDQTPPTNTVTVNETVIENVEPVELASGPRGRRLSHCSKNWASENPHVFSPRNQGGCGSCWAFSAAEALRQMYFVEQGQDPGALSTQYLVDCLSHNSCDGGVNGCCGGYTPNTFDWIKQNGGLPKESAYRYTSGDNPQHSYSCRSSVTKTVELASHKMFYSESSLNSAICNEGPVAIGIWASYWQHYHSGVMTAAGCHVPSAGHSNHAVQLVGVDTRKDAYIVQNSWGTGWGVSPHSPYNPGRSGAGFILLKYGSNTCNILTHPAIPTGLRPADGGYGDYGYGDYGDDDGYYNFYY